MDLTDLYNALKDSGIHRFTRLSFKSHIKESTKIDISGGTVERGGVYEVHARLLTRETHPNKAIEKAKEIQKHLYENVKGAFFNGKKVINIETTTPEPLYIGEENGVYLVSYNYVFLLG